MVDDAASVEVHHCHDVSDGTVELCQKGEKLSRMFMCEVGSMQGPRTCSSSVRDEQHVAQRKRDNLKNVGRLMNGFIVTITSEVVVSGCCSPVMCCVSARRRWARMCTSSLKGCGDITCGWSAVQRARLFVGVVLVLCSRDAGCRPESPQSSD